MYQVLHILLWSGSQEFSLSFIRCVVPACSLHGQRSLASYSPLGHKESGTAEHVRAHTLVSQRLILERGRITLGSLRPPGGPVTRTWRPHLCGPSSIPGLGTKILQTARRSQNTKKETENSNRHNRASAVAIRQPAG